jgi:hypothetical protein
MIFSGRILLCPAINAVEGEAEGMACHAPTLLNFVFRLDCETQPSSCPTYPDLFVRDWVDARIKTGRERSRGL